MFRLYHLTVLLCILSYQGYNLSLYPVDECFLSEPPQVSLVTGFDLAGSDADLLEWNGVEWSGSWWNSFITIPPPTQRVGCRAVFIGSGVYWNAPGEGFGMRLNRPMVEGQQYSFPFIYISHGYASNGVFSPVLSSNSAPVFSDAVYIMDLPPAGLSWVKNTITFTATSAMHGHHWLFLSTNINVSSGLISSYCEGCSDITTSVSENGNKERVLLYPNPVIHSLTVLNQEGNYKIISASGQVVASGMLNSTNAIDVSSLSENIYTLHITGNEYTVVEKFVKVSQ